MLRRHPIGLALALTALLALTACGEEDPKDDETTTEADEVTVSLEDPTGATVGTIEVEAGDKGDTQVAVTVRNLEPGYHGFHVHTTGKCEPDSADPKDPSSTGDFLSAGGHLATEGTDHGDHTGDLPSLNVAQDGTASVEFTTDRFTLADLRDDDGSAFMVHAGSDNYANIPDRYGKQAPDEETRGTGDAGDRVACAAVA